MRREDTRINSLQEFLYHLDNRYHRNALPTKYIRFPNSIVRGAHYYLTPRVNPPGRRIQAQRAALHLQLLPNLRIPSADAGPVPSCGAASGRQTMPTSWGEAGPGRTGGDAGPAGAGAPAREARPPPRRPPPAGAERNRRRRPLRALPALPRPRGWMEGPRGDGTARSGAGARCGPSPESPRERRRAGASPSSPGRRAGARRCWGAAAAWSPWCWWPWRGRAAAPRPGSRGGGNNGGASGPSPARRRDNKGRARPRRWLTAPPANRCAPPPRSDGRARPIPAPRRAGRDQAAPRRPLRAEGGGGLRASRRYRAGPGAVPAGPSLRQGTFPLELLRRKSC